MTEKPLAQPDAPMPPRQVKAVAGRLVSSRGQPLRLSGARSTRMPRRRKEARV